MPDDSLGSDENEQVAELDDDAADGAPDAERGEEADDAEEQRG